LAHRPILRIQTAGNVFELAVIELFYLETSLF